ncbi:uncharacterized protein LOC135171256 [Diachasmimorpha longicaudata]|uniref:uncharacterized protein LOC135171256 n=1 Tax=Diachasmimorpha longicaudata TaxID=58733 RepID=UPI0030B8B472
MDTDDEDVFAVNEDEVVIEIHQQSNPVEENLMKQLNEVEEQIERGNKQINDIQVVTDKIVEKLYRKTLYYNPEGSESDSDCEHYNESGVPVSKRQRRKKSVGIQPLVITSVWQRVIDNKWIIGVDLHNKSSRILTSPTVYVMIKDQEELKGVTCLWDIIEGSLWRRTDVVPPGDEHTVATVVLDMPTFQDSDIVEGHGIISYDIDGSHLQVPIEGFSMTAAQAVDKGMTPRHSADVGKSILAIKAASVERIVRIPLGQDLGDKIMGFLEINEFTEILPDVHVSKQTEMFRHCLIEILLDEDEVKLRIFARTTSQVNIITHLLRATIPQMTEENNHDKLLQAAMALEREIELRLEGLSPRDIVNASLVTDLLIPE